MVAGVKEGDMHIVLSTRYAFTKYSEYDKPLPLSHFPSPVELGLPTFPLCYYCDRLLTASLPGV